jgi:predicted dehydrogenase
VPCRYADDRSARPNDPKWRIHQDYRKLLDEKDVDAVIIATPDHGRVLPCIHACQAGKDIYAEKPLTLSIHEGRVLVETVRKHERILQVGSQQRSMAMNRLACEFVRNGGIGEVRKVQTINFPAASRIPDLPAQSVPADFNWDLWLGQAPFRPYNAQLLGWRAWWDYSGGGVTNMGAHAFDQVQWALGMDNTGPVEVWPVTPGQNGKVSFRYSNGVQVDAELQDGHGPDCGAIFTGTKGKVEINRNKLTTNPRHIVKDMPPDAEIAKWRDETGLWQAKYHIEDWLNCIKTRQLPNADVEIGHRSVTVCHLINIAREVGRKIEWDPANEHVVGDQEANRLVCRPRRKGYELPAMV